MEAYRCAYRDPKSPLTPLAPMSSSVFDFNKILTPNKSSKLKVTPSMLEIKSPRLTFSKKPSNKQTSLTPSDQKTMVQRKVEYSKYENSKENVVLTKYEKYEKYIIRETLNVPTSCQNVCKQSPKTSTTKKYSLTPSPNTKPKTLNIGSYFRPSVSPIKPKLLCTKVRNILIQTGMSKYLNIFETEEIDYEVFKMLTENDLLNLGVVRQIDRDIILNAVQNFSDFY